MRKPLLVLLSLAGIMLLPGALSAQATAWDGQLHKGDLSFDLGFGFGAHGEGFGYGIAAVPGGEWILADWRIGDAVPLAIGVGAKGSVEYIPATGLGIGADALAALHLGFKALDFYTALGAGIVYVGEADVPFGLVFPALYAGGAWYFREKLAFYLEGVYRNGWKAVGYGGAVFGIRVKKSPG